MMDYARPLQLPHTTVLCYPPVRPIRLEWRRTAMRTTTALIILALLTLLATGVNAATQYFPGKNPPGCTLKVEDPPEYRGRTTEGMTDELKRTTLEKKRAAGCPNMPDLDITYIERTPRYPRYYVAYGPDGTNPHLEGDQARMQRWPLDGQVVTFYGHVIN